MILATIHATAVALRGHAVLLLGPSGSGKSDLALRLIDRGWQLVADDRVVLTADGGALVASAPPVLAGLIEERGIGITAEPAVSARVMLAVDLIAAPERLPDEAQRTISGIAIPLLLLAPFEASTPIKIERALRRAAAGVEAAAVAPPLSPAQAPQPPMLIVTGMSGAGKSTALKSLEDLDYEAVDNLPLGLVGALLTSAGEGGRPLAFGIDTRTRAFDAEALIARIRALRVEGVDIRLLYLECSDEALTKRFSETRRRHPLAPDRPAADGIERERALTEPLKRWADLTLDTTDLSAADLRRRIGQAFGTPGQGALTVTITSFGFAHGLPRNADMVFDMRFLTNPHWDMALRPLTGEDEAVAAFVASDDAYAPAVDRIAELIETLLPGYGREGKAYLTIAFGCTGGRHRSVAVAREIARRLRDNGHAPVLVHRDLGKGGSDAQVIATLPEHLELTGA